MCCIDEPLKPFEGFSSHKVKSAEAANVVVAAIVILPSQQAAPISCILPSGYAELVKCSRRLAEQLL